MNQHTAATSAPSDAPAPSHVPAHLVRNVDIVNDPGVLADPWLAMDRLREQGRILWSPRLGGHWLVLGSAEVREAFQHGEAFSSYPTGLPSMEGFWPRKLIPQELDGEEHKRFRRVLSPFFSPGAIRPLAESVRSRGAELISRFADGHGCEFVGAFARPLPSAVFLDLFGAPTEQADTFTQWTYNLLHANDLAVSAETGRQIVGYLVGLIADRRKAPRDDLISGLIAADVGGRPLSDEELLDTAFLLFIAGLDTVTSQLGIVFHHLATHPDQQQALRADPASIRDVLEELLRVYPIVPPVRTLTRDYVLGGVEMRRGDKALLATSGASRDPDAFDDPAEARVGRTSTWTTAFGLGAHRCLGMHLARQELLIALELMSSSVPPFELAPDARPVWHTAGNVWGLDQLQLRFRPDADRRGAR
jgi:cytochrome P450